MREFIITNLIINISKLVIMKTFTKIGLVAALVCSAAVVNAQPSYAPAYLEYPTEDVLSIFSDNYPEYTELSTPTWGAKARWDYGSTADGSVGLLQLMDMDQEMPESETATVYEWIAIQFANLIETKAYTYLHVDVYCDEETDFRIGFHSNYPGDKELYFPNIKRGQMVPGKWYSIDYPLDSLQYTQADNQPEVGGWISPENGQFRNANLLRIGNGPDLFDYSRNIYITNVVLFNGEAKCLGGKVIEPETGISIVNNNYGFKAFATENTLSCRADESIKAIQVYNVTGQVVKSVATESATASIDIADLTSGIYVVAAEFANGQKSSLKIKK